MFQCVDFFVLAQDGCKYTYNMIRSGNPVACLSICITHIFAFVCACVCCFSGCKSGTSQTYEEL